MPIAFKCPNCGVVDSRPDYMAGQKTMCENCQRPGVVPGPKAAKPRLPDPVSADLPEVELPPEKPARLTKTPAFAEPGFARIIGRAARDHAKLVVIVAVAAALLIGWLAFNSFRLSSKIAAGTRAFDAKDYDLAASHFTEVIRLDPSNSAAFAKRGRCYLRKKQYEKTIEDCSEAIRLDAESAEALTARGSAYWLLGDRERGEKDYEAAIRANPNYAEAWIQKGRVAMQNQHMRQDAIEHFSKAIKLDPSQARAYSMRGEVHFELGNYPNAISDCSTAIELDGKDAWALMTRGNAYSKIGRSKEADADHLQASLIDSEVGELIRSRKRLDDLLKR